MVAYIRFYHFYRSALIRTIRILFLAIIIIWSITNYEHGISLKFPLFFSALLLQLEIFFHYKVSRITPNTILQKNDEAHLLESCTKEALERLLTYTSTVELIHSLLVLPQGRFILEKIPAEKKK